MSLLSLHENWGVTLPEPPAGGSGRPAQRVLRIPKGIAQGGHGDPPLRISIDQNFNTLSLDRNPIESLVSGLSVIENRLIGYHNAVG